MSQPSALQLWQLPFRRATSHRTLRYLRNAGLSAAFTLAFACGAPAAAHAGSTGAKYQVTYSLRGTFDHRQSFMAQPMTEGQLITEHAA